MEECNEMNRNVSLEGFCDSLWDDPICWPPSPVNTMLTIRCPPRLGCDTSKVISRYCDPDGQWIGNETDEEYLRSRGSIAVCFTEEMKKIMEQMHNQTEEEIRMRFFIEELVTWVELMGLTLSMISVLGSFIIYYFVRRTRNDRTKIHMHLFGAVLCSVVSKLIIIVDRLPSRKRSRLHNIPILCEFMYIVLEYSKSSVFMWMFVEALHLYQAAATLGDEFNITRKKCWRLVTATPMNFRNAYLFTGWGIPGIIVIFWAVAMFLTNHSHCWFAYNYNAWFWIMDGPRITTLIINTYFLIRILAVIFFQVSREVSNEMEQLRKTARATVTLLPLLGITHYLSYAEPPMNGVMWYFAFYSFVSYFLTSFHGTFVSLMYFLLTEEVKKIVIHSMRFISLCNNNDGNQDSRRSQNQQMDGDSICRESPFHDTYNVVPTYREYDI